MGEARGVMNREFLPDRRECELFDFEHSGRPYTAQIGRFEDGRLAETFIFAGKAGSDLEAILRDCMIIQSKALQYGVKVEDLRKSLTRNPNGRASSPVGALLDLVTKFDRKKAQDDKADNKEE